MPTGYPIDDSAGNDLPLFVVLPTGCWMWTRFVDRTGYGHAYDRDARRTTRAHRLVYEVFNGPIHRDLEIDHLCRFRSCVNPAHLEAVPRIENQRRGMTPAQVLGRRTTCNYGHPFDATNTVIRKSNGQRMCKICRRREHREFRARRRARCQNAAS